LAVVQLLAQHGELSARDVSSHLDINLSTTYNLLETLQARAWAERAPNHCFRLVPDNLPQLGPSATGRIHGPNSILWELHKTTGETCYLTVLRGTKVIIFEIIEDTTSHLRVAGLSVGFSGKEHLRAAGRAV